MAIDGQEALHYRNDDPALLAWKVKCIFDDDALAQKLSEQGSRKARKTHDAAANAKQLIDVYEEILSINNR